MTTAVTLVGSLRADSLNAALARAMHDLAPDGLDVLPGPSLDVPLFNSDIEAPDVRPAEVNALFAAVEAADAVVLVSPEYNHGVSGVLKNAIDWLSRDTRPLTGMPVGIAGATPSAVGTARAQLSLRPILSALGTHPLTAPDVLVAGAGDKFAGDPVELVDADTRAHVAGWLERFAAHTHLVKGAN